MAVIWRPSEWFVDDDKRFVADVVGLIERLSRRSNDYVSVAIVLQLNGEGLRCWGCQRVVRVAHRDF